MKKTLAIAFAGGAYGTYLEWVLNTLISADEIKSPFTKIGNSHNSELGLHLGDIDGFRDYLASSQELTTVRLHPKTKSQESLESNLTFLLDHAYRVILLYPDRSHELMCVCNFMTKIYQGDPLDGAMAYINPQDIYQGYGIDPGTDLRTISTWIRREHMSFNLFSSWRDQVEWYFPDHWQDPRAMIITTQQLFDQFEDVLIQIEQFWHAGRYHRSISDLMPFHREMIALQPHLGKDQICEQILQAAQRESDPIEFGELCLVSQAWIQHQLRHLGYGIRCHELNDFPTNTDHLRSLMYKF